ncbi:MULTISPECIES: hypothetical protein [Sphingomonadales]|jgi:hypothetical protein|uniref:Uncharacterized protein n=1 Tax=Novosphingobium resinovorum TaxID=158500 RepID=A0A031JPK1_9SPHN|nr:MULTISPECIES: hypothetical protein [Sphingomonadaceae]EZP77090.1 hypothetical protein BV97_04415 [Novosphingobium resinovorum]MDV3482230.1 hypothetical protein [Sphingobium yanoikuyae]
MAQEDLDALATVVQDLRRDLIRLQGAFARDALLSGRHSPDSLGDLVEECGHLVPGYEGSMTEGFVEAIRNCGIEGAPFTVISGGKDG